MWDHMVGKIFQRGSFVQANRGIEDRGFFRSSINARRRRSGQANMCLGFLHNFRHEAIAAEHSPRRIQKHQVGCAIRQRKRRQRLQRQREARLREDGVRAAARKSQTQKSVAPHARSIRHSIPLVIRFTIPTVIQRGGNGGSIR